MYYCIIFIYMLAHEYNIMIDHGIVAPGQGREVFNLLNAMDNFIVDVNGK